MIDRNKLLDFINKLRRDAYEENSCRIRREAKLDTLLAIEEFVNEQEEQHDD